jgi:hypothetical protein
MKSLITTILLLLLGSSLSAQVVWIDNLFSSPSVLTTADTVYIISETQASSTSCELFSTELEIDEANKEIDIYACYGLGPLTAICPSRDTFTIGLLQEGEYDITFYARAFETITGMGCSGDMEGSTEEIDITVDGVNSNTYIDNENLQFKLISNPVSEEASFYTNTRAENVSLTITDCLGRIVSTQPMATNEITTNVDVGQLSSGIYYCYLVGENSRSEIIRMVKR